MESGFPREAVATRLLTASVRTSYDPTVDIDWSAPLRPGAYWLPPERSSLYGTPLWDGLSDEQRVELTKHEVASAAGAGIWFETILMQMLIRHYYDADPTSRHAQYALTEVADECRHSIMFGRLIEATGCPVYRADPVDHLLGRWLKATATGPQMYAAILIAEEILDSFQREIMNDESLQPLIRMVSRIHVVEEARHVRFARDELTRQVEAAGPVALGYARFVIGRAAYSITRRLVHPRAYAAVGIAPAVGRAAARANPHWRATLRWSAQRIAGHLTELGLVAGPGRLLWRRAGLLGD
ncbi:AurF N-oxygenase family protein [Micromonospora auratinigra]|uniref:p-aminobenzoate N-oxygenase AurF n=1 Tax=Micromonospora auratinigra TaxID=261654 RepID=A0A1A8ZDK9_9ACTN|nr:diiron oxygenase [Micromonospora auratinigra]SBT41894.1 P-aminobenzoate N-oxygenase AurF [Micromonospora auratinigra]